MAIKDTPLESFSDLIANYIAAAIKDYAERQYEEVKKDLVRRLDEGKSVFVAGMVVNLMKTVDMQNAGDRLIITVREEKGLVCSSCKKPISYPSQYHKCS